MERPSQSAGRAPVEATAGCQPKDSWAARSEPGLGVEGTGDSPDHPGLQLEEGTESSSADADPRAGQEEGVNMLLVAVHMVEVLAFEEDEVSPPGADSEAIATRAVLGPARQVKTIRPASVDSQVSAI